MTPEELEDWMETSAELIGLEIPEICRVGVLENLQRNFDIAKKLENEAGADEPAPVFSA